MRVYRALALLTVLFALWTPFVAASIVPDPTWIAGIYDAADGDEIAIVAGDLSAMPTQTVVIVSTSAPRPVAPSLDQPVLAILERPSESRGPPAA